MKKLNFLFCGLALSMLVFFSCEKEEITSTKQSVAESVTQDELETKLLNSSNEALAHPNQLAAYPKLNNSFKLDGVSSIISVGVNPNLPSGYFHNRALDYIIERRSVVNPNNILGSVTELTKDYMNSMSELAISQEISDSYDLPPSEEAVENIANEIKRIHQIGFDNYITNESGLSNTAINLMNEMFNRVLENVDSNSTLGLSLLFTEFEARTILNFSLSNQEKNIILNGIAVGRYSTSYWFNVRNNPSNVWNDPFDTGEPQPQGLGKFWRRLLEVAVADIKGASAGAGVGAIFGVPQAGAVIGGAIYSANEGFNGGDD